MNILDEFQFMVHKYPDRAEIGILMCGAAFAPVLPEYPKESIKFIQEDCQAAARIDEDWLADIETYAPAEPVEVSGRKYTYAQTDEITDRLAAYIAGLGIGREQVVSVLIPRCEFMAIAFLGVSKAGVVYQPLDPSYSPERLQFMIQDSDAKLLIADEELLPLIPEWQGRVLLTKDILNLPQAEKVPQSPKPEDLFILLYTSGSTGVPKGCMVEHRNFAAFCACDGYFSDCL